MATERPFLSVGLTGGIGSGKSVVAAELQRLGAAVVDADVIAHQVTAPSGAAMGPIREHFGDGVIDTAGALDRAKMRTLVFADDAARRALEAIVHPLVRSAAESEAEAAARGGAPYVVFAIPLLVEAGSWRQRVDRVLVVDCPRHLQVRRVVRRSALTPLAVEAIIDRQASRAERLAAADDILVNTGELETLAVRAKRLDATYRELARTRGSRGAR